MLQLFLPMVPIIILILKLIIFQLRMLKANVEIDYFSLSIGVMIISTNCCVNCVIPNPTDYSDDLLNCFFQLFVILFTERTLI